MREINKVAVLGAGVMGQGIAAHLANAGIPSVLFDIVPKEAHQPRSKFAIDGIANARKLKPASFYNQIDASLITPANYEDDGALLTECDWIVEVVVENLSVKQKVYQWVADNRSAGSIVSSNTSGISLNAMADNMSPEMRKHFLVTHFFNPVRYMRLLELISGPETDPAVVQCIANFGEEKLGKGIVYCKDTHNFIANRIGCYGMGSVFKRMVEFGMNVEQVDAVLGKPMGRPSSAVFRTADLVGLDTLVHVLGNVYDGCPSDEARNAFIAPDWITRMVSEGALGGKTGKGFYKKSRDPETGKRVILVRDLDTGAYVPSQKVRFASIGKARHYDTAPESIRTMLRGDDQGSKLAWAVTADCLIYSANRIPEIADDIVNVDRALTWGFGWELGPFQTWDAIGVTESVARMEEEGRTVPGWVKQMLKSGRSAFYERNAAGVMTHWDVASQSAQPMPSAASWLHISDVKARNPEAIRVHNDSADLIDLGDGVALLEFHSKMNALDDNIIGLYSDALDQLDAGQWDALVVANQEGIAFSAGANLMMVGMAAMQGQWDELDQMVATLQAVCQRAKYSTRPVVTAPRGLTLGGGCELAMQSSHTQAGAELYMGLVEVGVGVIPAGGGCKEILARYLGDIPSGIEYDPNPFIQQAFKNMGLAKVSTSAEEARGMGYLRPTDRVTIDPDALVSDAKNAALGLVRGGYTPPRKRRFKVPGPSGRSAIELFLYGMAEGGFATEHDVTVGKKLAHVLTGGDVPSGTWVDENHILELEREAFVSLCGTEKTKARIQHFLMKGKPLRN